MKGLVSISLIFIMLTSQGAGIARAESNEADASESAGPGSQPFGVTVTWDATTGALVLTGYVSDEEAQQSVLETAQSVFPDAEIHNETHSGSAPESGWSRNGRWGMSQLKKLNSGVLEYSGSYVFLEGQGADSVLLHQIETSTLGLKPSVEHRLNLHLP